MTSPNRAARAQELLTRAAADRQPGESATDAVARIAETMTAEAEASFDAAFPAWSTGTRLGDAIDAGTLPDAVASAYRGRYVPEAEALRALEAVGGDDLVAAAAALLTLPEPEIDVWEMLGMADAVADQEAATAQRGLALAAHLRELAAEPFPAIAARLSTARTVDLVRAAAEEPELVQLIQRAERTALHALAERITLAMARDEIARDLLMWAAVLERRAGPTRDGDA